MATARIPERFSAGQALRLRLPGHGRRVRAIYGSGVYTTDSDLCTAAVHAGAIEKDKGGRVTSHRRPVATRLQRRAPEHGVKSNVWTRPFDSAFTIAPAPAE